MKGSLSPRHRATEGDAQFYKTRPMTDPVYSLQCRVLSVEWETLLQLWRVVEHHRKAPSLNIQLLLNWTSLVSACMNPEGQCIVHWGDCIFHWTPQCFWREKWDLMFTKRTLLRNGLCTNLYLELKVIATPVAKSVIFMLSSATILLTSMEMSGGLTSPRFTYVPTSNKAPSTYSVYLKCTKEDKTGPHWEV